MRRVAIVWTIFLASLVQPAPAQDLPGFVGPMMKVIIDEAIEQRLEQEEVKQPKSEPKVAGPKTKIVVAAPRLNKAQVMNIQAALRARGYDVGTVDGKWGSRTTAAVAAFQRDTGFEVTGALSDDQLVVLLSPVAPGTPASTPVVAANGGQGGIELLYNTDLPYNDYRSGMEDPRLKGITAEDCQQICVAEAQCRAFTFNQKARVCFLKHTAAQPEEFRGAISGRKISIPGGNTAPLVAVIDQPGSIGAATAGSDTENAPAVETPAGPGVAQPVVVADNTDRPSIFKSIDYTQLPPIWHGPAVCENEYRRSEPAEIDFIFSRRSDGNYDGRILIYYAPALSNGTRDFFFIGEDVQGGIRFVPAGRQPLGARPGEFTMTPAADGRSAQLSFSGGSCKSAIVQSPQASAERYITTVDAPANGGSYFSAPNARQRCEAIIAWASRVDKEFPELREKSWNSGSAYPKLAMLMGDDDFIPTFGRSFDNYSPDERWELARSIKKECRADPFVKAAFGEFDILFDRAFNSSDLGSFGFMAILDALRDQREVRNNVLIAMASADQSTGVEATMKARSAISTAGDLLWPSEKERMNGVLTAALNKQSLGAAQASLGALAMVTDPTEGILAVAEARKGSFMAGLAESDRTSYLAQLDAAEGRYVDTLMAPIVAKANAVSNDLAGATALQAILDNDLKPIAAASKPAQDAVAAKLRDKRDGLIRDFVDAKIAEMKALPGTLTGLESAVSLHTSALAAVEPLKHVDSKAKLTAAYADHRLEQLSAALLEYQSAIAKIADRPGREALLARYFIDKDELRQPVYLDYLFALELTP
jgi:peptidoglycan hydrolase-like protein with peptidoglycan-binding domain